jgi:hypothetical protein
MKATLPALALLVLGALPVVAQEVYITVPYGSHGSPSYGYGYSYGGYHDDYVYGNPYSLNFDPATAAINALNISRFNTPRPRRTFNVDRMITLNATGDSIMAHQQKCQARYSTYDMISDTYIGSNGIPRPCRL